MWSKVGRGSLKNGLILLVFGVLVWSIYQLTPASVVDQRVDALNSLNLQELPHNVEVSYDL